jgi:hypothetical protein
MGICLISLEKGGLYLGLNMDGLPHGRGMLLYTDKDSSNRKHFYEGDFVNSFFHGMGTMVFKKKGY